MAAKYSLLFPLSSRLNTSISSETELGSKKVSQDTFSEGFLWGTATSAYQTEGADKKSIILNDMMEKNIAFFGVT